MLVVRESLYILENASEAVQYVSDTVNQMFREAYEWNPSHINKFDALRNQKFVFLTNWAMRTWVCATHESYNQLERSCIAIYRTPSLDILIQLTALLAQVSDHGWSCCVVWSHIHKRLTKLEICLVSTVLNVDMIRNQCCLSLTRDTSGANYYGPIITHFWKGVAFPLGNLGLHRTP